MSVWNEKERFFSRLELFLKALRGMIEQQRWIWRLKTLSTNTHSCNHPKKSWEENEKVMQILWWRLNRLKRPINVTYDPNLSFKTSSRWAERNRHYSLIKSNLIELERTTRPWQLLCELPSYGHDAEQNLKVFF